MPKFLLILLLFLTFTFAGSDTLLKSGIDPDNMDNSMRPQDNFYYYANGNWLKKTEIPADKSNYGTFTMLFDENQKRLRDIIENCANGQNDIGSEQQKIGDFYLSYMDTVGIEKSGPSPLKSEIQKINSVKSRDDLLKLIPYLSKIGVGSPIGAYVAQDNKDATRYIIYFTQSGIGLPDRDYYFKEEERFQNIRDKYLKYMDKIFTLAKETNSAEKAKRIFDMETDIAKRHWTRVENRDRNKTYNKYTVKELNGLMPEFDWPIFLSESGVSNISEVIVRQPSFFEALDSIMQKYSIEDWKTYYKLKLLSGFSASLNKDFVDANFNFYRKTLSGIPQQRPRWKRAVSAVNGVMGEMVGKVYVAKYFKPEAKTRMVQLVSNLKTAFRERLNALQWMGPETKKKALEKLEKFNTKIGYPDKWKDYSALEIKKGELVQNYIRSSLFEYQRDINKLGKPIDRTEWFIPPQTVNAFYSPSMNEIVFPAAILQPPFFSVEADDAVNYGAIGAVIGHEMSHGFDDQGSKSDGDGNLVDWWTEKDQDEFKKRGQVLVEQFSKFEPLDSVFVNGELTLGENIGDLGGMAISFQAYQNSLKGKEAPVIDGWTGSQRFYFGWAQVWRRKYRDAELERRIMTDPHSPSEYRVNGILSDLPEFYEAFDIKPGDPMYRSEEIRAKIW